MADNAPKPPKAFISYSWDSEAHSEWVKALATKLRTQGVDVTLDQWDAAPGAGLPEVMERAIRENDFVIMICTPRYKEKMDGRGGGVGYEGNIMAGEALVKRNDHKFIPILRQGEWESVGPSWRLGNYYLDFSGERYSEASYEKLLRVLHGELDPAPPIGPRPDFKSSQAPVQPTPKMSVAKLALILEEAANLARHIDNGNRVFSEQRRVLTVIERVNRLLAVAVLQVNVGLDITRSSLERFVSDLKQLAAEADIALPHPGEDKQKFFLHRSGLGDLKASVIRGWSSLEKLLIWLEPDRLAYEEAKRAKTFPWSELGFANFEEFDRFIYPRTQDWLKAGGSLERALLEEIAAQQQTTEADLATQGYTSEAITEAFNALLRDEYFRASDHPTFKLTPVGRKMVRELLAKP